MPRFVKIFFIFFTPAPIPPQTDSTKRAYSDAKPPHPGYPHPAAGIQPTDLNKRRIADGLADAVMGFDHDAEGNTSVSK
jgi:hypothetical protein